MIIGDLNIIESTINAELRLGTIEKILDFILNNNYSLTKPTQTDIDNFKKTTAKELQSKYPNMGIELK